MTHQSDDDYAIRALAEYHAEKMAQLETRQAHMEARYVTSDVSRSDHERTGKE